MDFKKLDSLPDEIIYEISLFCEFGDHLSLLCISKRFFSVLDREVYWRLRCRQLGLSLDLKEVDMTNKKYYIQNLAPRILFCFTSFYTDERTIRQEYTKIWSTANAAEFVQFKNINQEKMSREDFKGVDCVVIMGGNPFKNKKSEIGDLLVWSLHNTNTALVTATWVFGLDVGNSCTIKGEWITFEMNPVIFEKTMSFNHTVDEKNIFFEPIYPEECTSEIDKMKWKKRLVDSKLTLDQCDIVYESSSKKKEKEEEDGSNKESTDVSDSNILAHYVEKMEDGENKFVDIAIAEKTNHKHVLCNFSVTKGTARAILKVVRYIVRR